MAVLTNIMFCRSFENTLQQIVKVIRLAYLLLAVLLVCQGLYKTLIKVRQQKVNVRHERKLVSSIKFPSVTFCYKYEHDTKDVMSAYSHQLFEKWKESGRLKICTNTTPRLVMIKQKTIEV